MRFVCRAACSGEGIVRAFNAVSCFRTRVRIIWCKARLEAQNVARGHLPLRDGMNAHHATQEAGRLQPSEMLVQRRSADLAIMGQPLLRGEAPEVRVEPVAEVPEHDLRRRLQPALLDRPVGGSVAHEVTLRAGRAAAHWAPPVATTRLVKP